MLTHSGREFGYTFQFTLHNFNSSTCAHFQFFIHTLQGLAFSFIRNLLGQSKPKLMVLSKLDCLDDYRLRTQLVPIELTENPCFSSLTKDKKICSWIHSNNRVNLPRGFGRQLSNIYQCHRKTWVLLQIHHEFLLVTQPNKFNFQPIQAIPKPEVFTTSHDQNH